MGARGGAVLSPALGVGQDAEAPQRLQRMLDLKAAGGGNGEPRRVELRCGRHPESRRKVSDVAVSASIGKSRKPQQNTDFRNHNINKYQFVYVESHSKEIKTLCGPPVDLGTRKHGHSRWQLTT